MKSSSSIKVGFLTLSAILILLFTVLWIKGRALSGGDRIEVHFKDVNGLRAGSAVQMMGIRIGQIEEITPIISAENSFVKLRFVITEKGIEIPNASYISIQQSGIIGEQFLEIMPPKIKTTYLPMNQNVLQIDDPVKMRLDHKLESVGKVINMELIDSVMIPIDFKEKIRTSKAYKVSYVITMPGLILPEETKSKATFDNELLISLKGNSELQKPLSDSKYTIIEPMRMGTFLELQAQAASSLAEVNNKINTILSDEMVRDLQLSITNINSLTKQASATLDKASLLVESSRNDIDSLLSQSEKLVVKLMVLSDNINSVVADQELKGSVLSATKSIDKLSTNVNTLIEDKQTKEIIDNTKEISKNLAEISDFVNTTTQDPVFKNNINKTLTNVNKTLETVNKCVSDLDPKDKAQMSSSLSDVVVTTRNLRKFSEKLNKRFLLFRLMF